MILVVGLGNPGRKFQKTRHNLGFEILNTFKKENGFSNWQEKKGLGSKISQARLARKKIILAQPQTFMNSSGRAAKLLINNYGLKTKDLIIVHDDISLAKGEIKISRAKGAAGHKGVQSIIDETGTKDLIRLRVGIGLGPESQESEKIEEFVLKKFNPEEKKIFKEKKTKERAGQALELIIRKGEEAAMNEFN